MKTNVLKHLLALLLAATAAPLSHATTLEANPSNSRLTFSGEHAGMAFSGTFSQWQSTLVLPPSSPPRISATFALASAKTGDRTYDGTLPEGDWFDVKQHPQAQFTATDISANADNTVFTVRGDFTLKGITQPVQFDLVRRTDKNVSSYTASFPIDRLAFGIGRESDPEAEWVSQFIEMSLTINAKESP